MLTFLLTKAFGPGGLALRGFLVALLVAHPCHGLGHQLDLLADLNVGHFAFRPLGHKPATHMVRVGPRRFDLLLDYNLLLFWLVLNLSFLDDALRFMNDAPGTVWDALIEIFVSS